MFTYKSIKKIKGIDYYFQSVYKTPHAYTKAHNPRCDG